TRTAVRDHGWPRLGVSVEPWKARLVSGHQVLRSVIVERLEEALRRGDAPAARVDVRPDSVPERGVGDLLAHVVDEVAALYVDDLVVAGRGVLVDRQVEPGRRAARSPSLAE